MLLYLGCAVACELKKASSRFDDRLQASCQDHLRGGDAAIAASDLCLVAHAYAPCLDAGTMTCTELFSARLKAQSPQQADKRLFQDQLRLSLSTHTRTHPHTIVRNLAALCCSHPRGHREEAAGRRVLDSVRGCAACSFKAFSSDLVSSKGYMLCVICDMRYVVCDMLYVICYMLCVLCCVCVWFISVYV